ncbi:hypothetical protein [Pseudomonas denitrificans (nom. rej.)]
MTRLGIALWNREEAVPPAPGAVLLVPLNASDINAIART